MANDMKKQHYATILCFIFISTVWAQLADSAIFEQKKLSARQGRTLAEKTLSTAKSFLGTPYVSGTLEQAGEEHLIVNFEQLDCWTFVENSLAIALSEGGNFQNFKHHLQQLRYWGGQVDGYGSRIHYFSGWILQAEKRGLLQDVSKDLGGEPYQADVSYISKRPNKYPRIKDPNTLRDIRAAERRINAHRWYYIPQERVAQMEHLIQEGDIISLTAWKPDLDIAHQGFAVRVNGRIHLLHASSLAQKVIISKQPLPDYLLSQRGQTGIMVARLKR